MGRIVGACTLAALSFPAVSSASQVIGQTAPGGSGCFTSSTYRQVAVSGDAGYGTATRGVVTAWRTYGGSATDQTLQLVTMHADPSLGAGGYAFDSVDAVRIIAANSLNTFGGVRLPIPAGGEIGLHVPFGSTAACVFAAFGADTYAIAPGNATQGGTATFVGENPGSRVNASASVEPDADGDGFGDETQDRCPSKASTQGPCVKKCKKKRHRRQSAGSARKHKRCHKKRKP